MSPKQSEAGARRNVARLAKLISEPSNKENVNTLVTALLAKRIDVFEKSFVALGNQLKKMRNEVKERDGDPEHLDRIEKQIRSLDQDAASLRQLVEASDQKDIETKADLHQLSTRLAEAIERIDADDRSNREVARAVELLAEEQKQHNNEINEAIKMREQHTNTLGCAIRELKFGLAGVSFDTEHIKTSIARFEETIANLSRTNNPSLAVTVDQLDAPEQFADEYSAQENRKQLAIGDGDISGPSPTRSMDTREDRRQQLRIKIKKWPAAEEFLTIFEERKAAYRSEQPESEMEFIKGFLSVINVHASCVLQRHLLHKRPDKIKLVTWDVGQQPPTIFIELSGLVWEDLRRAVPSLNLASIETAVERKLSGPKHRKLPMRRDRSKEFLPPSTAKEASRKRKRTPALEDNSSFIPATY